MPEQLPITNPTTPQTGADGTPTGLKALTAKANNPNQLQGSSGADRATLFDIERDQDHVISLGDGDDVFVFGANTQSKDLNGIVKMGDGNDSVYLSHLIEDYVFTLRSDGSLKIQYLGEPDGKGDAVTFYDAEQFVFRNISEDGTNYTNTVLTYDQIVDYLTPAV